MGRGSKLTSVPDPFEYADVCVTGGLGFIGAHLCQALADRGARVRCVDRAGSRDLAGGAPGAASVAHLPNVTIVHADVGGDPLDDGLDGVEAVVHLAALPGVRAGHSAVDLWCENTLTTARLARETARRGQRLVLASTSSIYGDATRLPTDEGARPSPLNPYAASKLAAEHACLTAVDREGADAVIARLFTVFGERQRPDMAFARWIDAMRADKPIRWCARAGTARDFTYVGDAVAGLIAALEHGRPGQIYNIAGSGATPLHHALSLLEGLLGHTAWVDRTQFFAGEATVTSACGRKAARELGYRPRCSLAEGLERQVDHVVSQCTESETPSSSTERLSRC